jgi:hypothetical protein
MIELYFYYFLYQNLCELFQDIYYGGGKILYILSFVSTLY